MHFFLWSRLQRARCEASFDTFMMLALAFSLLLLLATSASATPEHVDPASFNPEDYELDVSDQYLVLFEEDPPTEFDDDVAALGGKVIFKHEVGFAVVGELSVEAAEGLGALPYVNEMLQDDVIELDPTFDENTVNFDGAVPQSPADPTQASFYSYQWNMRAIGADEAWEAGRLGSPDVTVAILDTGIDYEYPDLLGRVDLARSASFVPIDDYFASIYFPTKHPVTDLHYHGTHAASTVVSNSNVIAGVTTQTELIGIKVCSAYLGYCPWSSILQGVLHAADNGADVANMSLGGSFKKNDHSDDSQRVNIVNRVFNYANRKKMTIIVAAGNSAEDLDHNGNVYNTFCDTPNTMCVSATGPDASGDVDAPAPYTNFGRSAISVAAPGGAFALTRADYGLVWAACSKTSLVIPACRTGNYALALGGTSMAAPHVSGLAALLVEKVGKSPARVKAAIQKGADDLGQRGVDPYYGKGRINVPETLGL